MVSAKPALLPRRVPRDHRVDDDDLTSSRDMNRGIGAYKRQQNARLKLQHSTKYSA
jgi:hypothetical protein